MSDRPDRPEPAGYWDPPSHEEGRVLLLEEHEDDIPPELQRALDRVPRTWNVLWAQAELHSLQSEGMDDPDSLEAAANSLPADHSDRRTLRYQQIRAQSIHDWLAGQGFTFNAEARTLVRRWTKETGSGWEREPDDGRPQHLFNRLVEALFEELPLPEGVGAMNHRKTRERIGEVLGPFFDPELCDPRRGHDISNIIKDYLKNH